MTFLAKSTGLSLEEHNLHLLQQCDQIFPAHRFACQKYAERTEQDLEKLVRSSVPWHDAGKKHPKWQGPCRKDFEEGNKDGKHIRNAHIRHELASLEFIYRADAKLPLPVRIAIAAHHGKLSRKHKKRWEEHKEFEKFWDEFACLGNSFRVGDFDQVILKRYEFAGPRALLQLADHRASASENRDIPPDFHPFEYKFPYSEKHGVQTIIEGFWDEPFAILRAPTGAGKTDAALLWAEHQIALERAERLVIAMPTRFTANALAISTAKDLSKNGLYHSSAWLKADKKELDKKELEQARLLETPVTVTTIDHLCISLTGTREDHHGIFFNLAHSCIVIDEADFYDDFTQQNIIMLLRALRLLNVPVLLMSATVPTSAKELYAASGFTVSSIHEDTTDYERTRCILTRQGKSEKPEDIKGLLQRALDGEPTIIYANTVRRAQAYYHWFRNQQCKYPVVLYHSRFTEPHKAKKEQQLYELLGQEAWAKENANGVAVLTQIGELSVNISANFMVSDLCPIDRLTQRVGRLARFTKEKPGELFVVDPYQVRKEGSVPYPAPYGRWINGRGWEPGKALEKSDELLKDGAYSAERFVDLVNALYPEPSALLPHVADNCRALEDCIIGNWLLLPQERVKEDDDNTKDWKSRDIPAQATVYADFKHSGVFEDNKDTPRNWSEFRRFQLYHGIECPKYQFNSACESGLLTEYDKTAFVIGEETEEVWIIPERYYDFELGLHLEEDE